MTSAICTLFENQYHYGVVALTNSLYSNGFRGAIYAGYRGPLPKWTVKAGENTDFFWKDSKNLQVADGLNIYLLPLQTDYHLTNYKPDFMLELLEGPAKSSDAIFYFDPDIVVTAPWDYIREWSNCGISLCEDINSPISKNNPRRVAWRKYFGEKGFSLEFKDSIYANGGFIGVSKINHEFLHVWKDIQCAMATKIGGLHLSALTGPTLPTEEKGPFASFSKTDQDALNAAVEVWQGELSFLGKEGMGFTGLAPVMPHALGSLKPWNYKPLIKALALLL